MGIVRHLAPTSRFGVKLWLTAIALLVSSAVLVAQGGNSTVQAATCGSEPASVTGKSTQTITVPTTGTYTLWSRLKAPDASPVEYTAYVNGQCVTVGQTALTPGTLTWVDYENGSASDKATVDLTAGTHTLILTAGSEALELDRVMLLTDSCTPTGTGDNCLNDTANPTASISSPTAGATLSGTATIAATASDNDAIDRVEFYRGGTTLLGTDNSAPYSYSWDTTSVGDGSYQLTVRAYDLSDNSVTSSSVAVTVDNVANPVNADITSFTATPATITDGDSSSLAWAVAAGQNCAINQGIGNVGLTGNRSVSPSATTTYTLTCEGANGGTNDTATATVTVGPAPVDAAIATFTATPATITAGDSSTLDWSVSAGQTCSINQGVGSVANNGTLVVSPTTTTAYTLTCNGINGGANDTASVTVTVGAAPVDANITSFTATPATITAGSNTTLAWNVAAGQNCAINQSVGSVGLTGSRSVSPATTTTYTLTCNGINGGTNDTDTATVTVNPAPIDADITSFTATPASITDGDSSTLAWTVAAGQSCSINQGVGAVASSGSQVVTPTVSTTYTLTCNGVNGGSNDTATTTVTVTAAVVVDSDGDGISDAVENAGPNDGDANHDGTPDADQANVVTLRNAKTDAYNTLVAEGDCAVITDAASLAAGSIETVLGAWSFNLTCTQPGDGSNVTIYLDKQYDTAGWQVVKYDAGLSTPLDITDRANLTTATLGSTTVTSLTYTLTDGGELDADGVADGAIVDPVTIQLAAAGPTVPTTPSTPGESSNPDAPGVPSTGFAPAIIKQSADWGGVLAVVVSVILTILSYRKLASDRIRQ